MWVILITIAHLGLSLTYRHDPFSSYEACAAFTHSETFQRRLAQLSEALGADGGDFGCVPEAGRDNFTGEDS